MTADCSLAHQCAVLLTRLKDVARQALHEFSRPGGRGRLPYLSFQSKGELEAKAAGFVYSCESDTNTRGET